MTKEILKELVLEKIDEASSDMKKKVDKALNSGAVECSQYDDTDYRPAKIVLCALLQEERYQWRPLVWNDKERKNVEKEIENVYRMM